MVRLQKPGIAPVTVMLNLTGLCPTPNNTVPQELRQGVLGAPPKAPLYLSGCIGVRSSLCDNLTTIRNALKEGEGTPGLWDESRLFA